MKKNIPSDSFTYSICTIVNDMDEYELMKTTFINCGFTETAAEYLYFDNTGGNKYDAYSAIKQALGNAANRFIIMVHQDVRCIDPVEKLNALLNNLNDMDPNWAVCGNAGVAGYHEKAINISYENEIWTNEQIPIKVKTLDENFLILDTQKKIQLSPLLSGFHMYGTDLCLHAGSNGYTCYVLPFMVKHLSKGNLKNLNEYIPYFLKNAAYATSPGYVETTCTKFYLSTDKNITTAANNRLVFYFIKFFQRLRYVFRKIKGVNKNAGQVKRRI